MPARTSRASRKSATRSRAARPAAPGRKSRRAEPSRATGPRANGAFANQVAQYDAGYPKGRERKDLYPYTISGIPIRPLYGPEDLSGMDLARDLAVPGEYPFTRGVHPTMYRGRMFTMRQFAGFG